MLLVPDRVINRVIKGPSLLQYFILKSVLLVGLMQDLPEPGMSRGPFELVLFVQMDSEVVASGEALATHMTLVASNKAPLIKKTLRGHA